MRMKERSEGKILLAKARGNMWKLARDPQYQMEEREEEAWRVIGEGVIEFTEQEDWEEDYKVDIRGLLEGGLLRKPKLEVKVGKESGEQKQGDDGKKGRGLYLVQR